MANEYLQDGKGNKSSKRLWGSICLGTGLLLGIGTFIVAIRSPEIDISQLSFVFYTIFGTGTGLLGIGVAEKLSK